MKFGNTANRGFYYGSSQDSPWNQDLCWRAMIEKEAEQMQKYAMQSSSPENSPSNTKRREDSHKLPAVKGSPVRPMTAASSVYSEKSRKSGSVPASVST